MVAGGLSGMRDIASSRARIKSAGYELLGDVVLPEEAWWDGYYNPMAKRIAALRLEYADIPAARAALDGIDQEIAWYRQYPDFYGYLFSVCRIERRASSDPAATR